MEQFFEDIFLAITIYWDRASLSTQWPYLLITLLLGACLVWLLAWFISKIGIRSEGPWTTSFRLYKSWFLASVLLNVLLISIIAGFECRASKATYILGWPGFSQFNLLVVLLISLIASGIRYKHWSKTISMKQLFGVSEVAITPSARDNSYRELRKQIVQWRWIIILPLMSFLWVIPCQVKKEKVFIAIVLDNSDSMADALKDGKSVLADALFQLNMEAEYLIATLQKATVSDMDELLTKRRGEGLAGVLRQFSSTSDAVSYITSDQVKAEPLNSPISEAIWKTFLKANEDREVLLNDFEKRALIVVTDGMDRIQKINTFFCFEPEFNDLFSPAEVLMVDVRKYNGAVNRAVFFKEAEKCGYAIGDGSDYRSYLNSVETLIGDISRKPPYWTLWAAIIFSLFVTTLFIISPAKL